MHFRLWVHVNPGSSPITMKLIMIVPFHEFDATMIIIEGIRWRTVWRRMKDAS
jgi:hypothetical protein